MLNACCHAERNCLFTSSRSIRCSVSIIYPNLAIFSDTFITSFHVLHSLSNLPHRQLSFKFLVLHCFYVLEDSSPVFHFQLPLPFSLRMSNLFPYCSQTIHYIFSSYVCFPLEALAWNFKLQRKTQVEIGGRLMYQNLKQK